MRLILLAAVALSGVGLALTACGAESAEAAAPVLRFTAIPDKNTQDLVAKFDPLADWLARQLGVAVEYVPSGDYEASVQMFKNGDVQLAWFGGLTSVQACAAVPGARAIVMGKEDPRFKSYFIAHAGTGIEPSAEFPRALAGRKFTFGPRKSTSGRLMPEHFVRVSTGQAPDEFFAGTPGFQDEGHDATWKAVESGQYDAGVLNYQVYEDRVAQGRIDPEVVRVIWETPPYADYNMTVHPAVDEQFGAGFTTKLQQALVSLSDPKLLAAFGRTGMIEASNEDFATCAEVARSLDLLR